MDLFYKKSGTGPPLLILHGLFGSSDNWFSVAKALSADFTLYIPDMRNHGRSQHDTEHTYEAMAEDVRVFAENIIGSTFYLIGHSMGGKAAMSFVLKYPQWVQKLIVVDIAPRSYSRLENYSHQSVDLMNIIQSMLSVDLSNVHSRSDAENAILEYIPDHSLRSFILKNLMRQNDGSYRWCLNLEVLKKSLPGIIDAIPERNPHLFRNDNVSALFIRGGNSDYITDEDAGLIHDFFPDSSIIDIPGTGHWPQAEKPVDFVLHVKKFLLQH